MANKDNSTAAQATTARMQRSMEIAAAHTQRYEKDHAENERIKKEIADIKFSAKGVEASRCLNDILAHVERCKEAMEMMGVTENAELQAKLKAIEELAPVRQVMSDFQKVKEAHVGSKRWLEGDDGHSEDDANDGDDEADGEV